MRALRLEPDVWSGLRGDFAPHSLATTLVTGLILGMVNLLLTTALISLIYRGELEEFLSAGLGYGLVGSSALALILALGSSFRGMYGGSQDASAAILGLSAASVAGALVGIAAFETVVAMVVVTSVATGLAFLAMGYLGVGDIARFVPFPVIGGLLAGTGYLIVTGAIGILGVGEGSDLLRSETAGSFWPGLLLAVLFFVASRRSWGSGAYLSLIIVAVAGFHVLAALGDLSQVDAMERGWLLGPFPDGGLWPGPIFDPIAGADWGVITGEAAGLVTILLIVPITLLLYLSALEVETRSDVDVNRELRMTGWGNVAAGALGAPPGYMYFSDTAIASRLVGARRGPAVVAALATFAVVAFASFVLELVPLFVIGGLLLFVGAEFLYEWLWASRRRMSRVDFALLLAILVVIAVVGFLPGVAVGLVSAVGVFVVRYSRIDVIKHSLTGGDQQSNIERAAEDAEYLQSRGHATLILELQGFIFFGTASQISTRVKASLQARPELDFLLCDFRRVTGIDSSAVVIFERIATMARDHGVVLVITGLGETHLDQLGDLISERIGSPVIHMDLDHGLAWCEDQLLEQGHVGVSVPGALPGDLADDLIPFLSQRTVAAGETLMRQGDPTPGILLISSGQATVSLDVADGQSLRLRTLLSGTVLGEISLYRDEPCSATVVTDTVCEILHLTPERFGDLCRDDPMVAARLHRFVARTLAGRVSHANRTIRALRD
jgi:SulP family sulfate permease